MYVYFDNDMHGFAPINAATLQRMMKGTAGGSQKYASWMEVFLS